MPDSSYPNFAGKHAGEPLFTAALEELAALGTSAVISVGTAGSLQRDLKPGDLVLCGAAIRDEGVSHHYLPPGRLATAPAEMTVALGTALRQAGLEFRTGTSWTIDTPYRETLDEVRHYQAEGVLCVEMEAAALFAVAEVRGVRLASAFVISDSLAELTWSSHFGFARGSVRPDRVVPGRGGDADGQRIAGTGAENPARSGRMRRE